MKFIARYSILLSLLFCSCSLIDNEELDEYSEIVGKWRIIYTFYFDENGNKSEEYSTGCDLESWISFDKFGKFVSFDACESPSISSEGTYEIEKGFLKLNVNQATSNKDNIFSILEGEIVKELTKLTISTLNSKEMTLDYKMLGVSILHVKMLKI